MKKNIQECITFYVNKTLHELTKTHLLAIKDCVCIHAILDQRRQAGKNLALWAAGTWYMKFEDFWKYFILLTVQLGEWG